MAGREQLGPYTLTWPDGVFPLGQDTLALGEFATVRAGWQICDLGTGSGALLLLLARREAGLALHGVDLDAQSVRTARANLADNGLDGTVVQGDLRGAPFPSGQFDLVISNPPYFSPDSGPGGGLARCEEQCTLEQLCSAAGRLTRNGGRFALCHRPERLTDVLLALRSAGLEPKRLQLLSHAPGYAPSCILVESVRQGRPGLQILPEKFRT